MQFIYATADEADAYMFYRCFFVLLLFVFFRSPQKYQLDNRSRETGTAERIYMKLLPNDSGENGVCIAVRKWGLGPRLIFGGYKLHIAHLVVTPGDRVTEN